MIKNKLIILTHEELVLFVTQDIKQQDFISDNYERFLCYEAYIRHERNIKPFNIKWVESTLRLSFPKVHLMVEKLVEENYLEKEVDDEDHRILLLKATEKLLSGLEFFESMRHNELHKLGLLSKKISGIPCLSDFHFDVTEEFRKDHLGGFTRVDGG